MHDDDVRPCPLGASGRKAVVSEVFSYGRKKRLAHPLELHTQHHHDVGTFHNLVHGMADMDELSVFANNLLDTNGHQRGSAAQPYMRSEFREQMCVRPRDPAVSHVTDNCDLQIV